MIIEYYVFLNIFYKLTELIDRHIQFQVNRTVLHYAARCQDETIRNEITEESIKNGADKFARDDFGNDSEFYVTNEFPPQLFRNPKVGLTNS